MKKNYGRFKRAIYLLLFITLFSGFKSYAQNIIYIDTALSANTVIYLDSVGQAFINLDTSTYNTTTDVVFISKIPYNCSNVGDSLNITITITDKSVNPWNTYYVRNTKIVALDSIAPRVKAKKFHSVYLNQNGTDTVRFADVDLGTWDSCGVDLNSISFNPTAAVNCTEVGAKKVWLLVTDIHGNVDSAKINLTVFDTITPTLLLKTDTVFINPNLLSDTVFFNNINNGSFDNCGLDSATLNGASFVVYACADTGANTINVKLYDSFGNSSAGVAIIYVTDTTGFSYVKTPLTVYLGSTADTLSRDDFLTPDSAGCFIPKLTFFTDTILTCNDISANPNYIIFKYAGNSLDSVSITVLDTLAPNLLLKTDTLILNANGFTDTLTFANINNGSTDNCSLDSATLNGASQLVFACADGGANQVTVILYDVNGNLTTDSVTVYVLDTATVSYTKFPQTVYINTGADTLSRNNFVSPASGGGCFTPVLTIFSDTVFNCASISTNPNYIVFQYSGAGLDSVLVTVLDTVKPNLVLKTDTFVLNGFGLTDTIRFAILDNGSADNCALDSATLNGFSNMVYSCADTGFQQITVQLFDVSGNFQTDSVLVYVLDTAKFDYVKTPQTVYIGVGADTLSRNDFLTPLAGGCSAPSLTILSDTIFDCADIATNPNYIVFQYSGLNLDSVLITVLDTLAPNLLLKTDTLILNANGFTDTLTFANINNGSTDNCTLDSATLNGTSQLVFACVDGGANQVTVILYDVNGNLTTDSVTVYVLDTATVSYTKFPQTVYINTGADTLTRNNFVSPASGGGCFTPVLTIFSDTIFNCANIAANPNYIVFQYSGAGLDSVKITVADTVKPNLVLKTDTFVLNGFGLTDTIRFAILDNGSADNCALDSATLNGFSNVVYSCADTGFQQITVQLFDVSGNSQTDSVLVYVLDTAKFDYVKTPQTVYIGVGADTLSRNDFLTPLAGGCSAPSLTILSDTIFDCADIATNPNYIVFQYSGLNLDSVLITVLDTLKPTLVLKTDTLLLNANGFTDTLTFANINNGSADNCSLDSATLNGASQLVFACADGGANQVTVILYDVNGNLTTDSVTVYVLDTATVSYTKFPQTVYINTGADTLSRNNFVSPASGGGCFTPVLTIFSDTVFDCTSIAANPNYIVFQYSGASLDSVKITVADTVKPNLVLKSDTVFLNNPAAADTINFARIDNGSFDNCALDSATLNGVSELFYSCADTGTQLITVVLWDANNNSRTASINVYVLDTVTPGYSKTPYTANLIGDSAVVSRTDILSNATGGCFPPKLTLLSDTVFYCSNIAANPRYIRFKFTGGTIDSVAVTVADTTKPTLVLQNQVIYLNTPNASDSIEFSHVNNASFDNCSLDSATLNGATQLFYTCTDTGLHKVQVLLWDVNGNSALDTVNILVLDTASVVYTKNSVKVYVGTTADTLSRNDFVSPATAGCFTPALTIFSDTIFNCSDITTNPNYIKFKYAGAALDSVEITVFDTLKPTLVLQSDTVYMGATISDTLFFSQINNGSFDNCSLDTAQLNGQSFLTFTCSNLGAVNVNVTLFDKQGNFAINSVTIYVVDTITPNYIGLPFTAVLVGTTVKVSRTDFLTNINGGCSTPTVSILSDTIFDCSDIANNPNFIKFQVLGQAIDSVQITVADQTPPTFDPKSLVNLNLNANGIKLITLLDLLNAFPIDSCGVDTIFTNPRILDCSNTSSYSPITVTATDVNGNTDSTIVYVLAIDVTNPVIITQNNTIYLDSLGQATIGIGDVTTFVSDTCGLDTVYLNKYNFSCSNIGLNSINITAKDVNQNITSATAQITILDTTAPAFNVVTQHNVYLNNFGLGSLAYADVSVGTAYDACGIVDTTISKMLFGCADVGVQNILISLKDVNNNISVKTVLINVLDTISPTLTTQTGVFFIDTLTGITVMDFNTLVPFRSDNCSLDPASFTVTPSFFTCDSLGFRTVTVSLKDFSGNQSSKKVQVEIKSYNTIDVRIIGPASVCQNSYNVKYFVASFQPVSKFKWTITGGNIISTSYKGREVYVHWTSANQGIIKVEELNASSCAGGLDIDTVNISGNSPDTATINYWNPVTRNTLVSSDVVSNYFKWGFDFVSFGNTFSTYLPGANTNSFYQANLPYLIDSLDYKFWCETSFDNICWTRSYFKGSYPITITELETSAVEVWPNPYSDVLVIKSNRNITNVEVYDLYGKKVYTNYFNNENKIELNQLGSLPDGTFIVIVSYKKGEATKHRIIHAK